MSDITITKLSLFTLFIRTRCLTQTCIKMKTRYKMNAELPLMLAVSHFHPLVSPTWKVKALLISFRKAIEVYCPGLWPPSFLLTLSSPWKTFISISPVLSVVPARVITVCDFLKVQMLPNWFFLLKIRIPLLKENSEKMLLSYNFSYTWNKQTLAYILGKFEFWKQSILAEGCSVGVRIRGFGSRTACSNPPRLLNSY